MPVKYLVLGISNHLLQKWRSLEFWYTEIDDSDYTKTDTVSQTGVIS